MRIVRLWRRICDHAITGSSRFAHSAYAPHERCSIPPQVSTFRGRLTSALRSICELRRSANTTACVESNRASAFVGF